MRSEAAILSIRRNAGWLTAAAVLGGALNFVFALGLTWLLPVRDYAVFAGIQALLVVSGTAASASAPWLLSQRIARSPSTGADSDAVSFAVWLTLLEGGVAAAVSGALAARIAGSLLMGAVTASAAMAIFMAATSTGYLQGRQRFARVALLLTAEVVVKVVSAVVLIVAGLGVFGVVAGILLGSIVLAALAAPPMLRQVGAGTGWLRDRQLWELLLGLTGVQVGVVLLCNVDLIVGGLLARDPAGFAGYQVAVLLSRVPFYLASSLSIAVFTGLASRRTVTAAVIAPTLSIMLATVTVVGLSVATLPSPVARLFLPHSYPALVVAFVPFTAAAGALAALTNLGTTFFQAEGRFRAACLALAAGIAFETTASVVGLQALGVRGLLYASLGGQALAALLLLVLAARAWGGAVRPRPWPVLAAAAVLLPVLRSAPPAWLAYSALLTVFVAWQALFRGRKVVGGEAAESYERPRVYLLTVGPISPPWNGGDTNLGRSLVDSALGVHFTYLGQRGDGTPPIRGHHRRELSFGQGAPSLADQLRILARLASDFAAYDLVHLIATFGSSRLKADVLAALPLLRRHALVVTCPNGLHLPSGLLRRADLVVATSRWTEKRLRANGVHAVEHVAPGINLQEFRPGQTEPAQSRLGLASAPYLFFAGHHDPGGGLEAALRLTASLRQRFPDLRLLTAMRSRPGREQEEQRARALALTDSLDLGGCVVDLGECADVRTALQASRAVVFQPSVVGQKMDLPMVLLEALASGRPIVVSDVGALSELADGSNAVTVCAEGGAEAEERLAALLTSASQAARAAREARELAERRFSAETMAAAYSSLYSRLLGRDLARSTVSALTLPEVAG
jgi:glycosyltransferase involved in cell wall biosynthesis/O-antigen/teichoic acid export membrane protein